MFKSVGASTKPSFVIVHTPLPGIGVVSSLGTSSTPSSVIVHSPLSGTGVDSEVILSHVLLQKPPRLKDSSPETNFWLTSSSVAVTEKGSHLNTRNKSRKRNAIGMKAINPRQFRSFES